MKGLTTGIRWCVAWAMLSSTSAVASADSGEHTLTLTPRQVEDQLQAVMPVSRRQSMIVVKLDNPSIRLHEDSQRVGVGVDLGVSGPLGLHARGDAIITGGLRYKRDEGAFYLDKARLETLRINSLPRRFQGIVRQAVESIMVSELRDQPLYQFPDDQLGQLARTVLRSVKIRKDSLLLILGLPK